MIPPPIHDVERNADQAARARAQAKVPPGVPLFVYTVTAFTAMAAGGVVALAAWLKRRERSLLVALAIVPALFAIYFVLGEFAFPH